MTSPGSHGPGEQPPGGGPTWGPPAGSPQPGSVPPLPPGQFPQGQQPGQYPQGQYPQGQFPPGQGWTPPQSKSSTGMWLAIGGGILAVLVIGVLTFAFLSGADPEVGDCLEEDSQELSVVDCDDSAAEWKLLGIQEGEQSYDEYLNDPETCSAFPEAVQSYWIGENGDETGQGLVYCMTTP